MEKKYVMFGLLGLFAMALVSGALLTYYGQIEQNVNVEQAVVLTCPDNDCIESTGSLSGLAPITLSSEVYSVKNVDPQNSRDIELVTTCLVDVGEGDYNCAINEVTTSYVGVLELTTKDGAWDGTNDRKVTVEYSIVGDVFTYTIIEGEGTLDISDYKLVYYKDDPTSADDTERMNTLGTVYVIDNGEDIGNLPMTDDWNVQELANYCGNANGFDDYKHCKGAKLWLVPNANAVDGLVNWDNYQLFLYETDLIVYSTDVNDVITLPAEGGFDFMVESTFAGTGDYTITTEVLPVSA